METKEKNFEQDIESWLLTEGGYVKGTMATYDKRRAIDMPVLIQFIEVTQHKQSKIEELKEYKKSVIYEYVTGKKEVV